MAGSGKTTFMQRINSALHTRKTPPYVMNLDPAVRTVPFESNIDIRDSVNYKEVMKQYNLGPNGGILTSLNLFATKVDQVLALLEKRTMPGKQESPVEGVSTPRLPKHIIVDTPGQIEVFVWSASGDIILGSLASSFPTVIAYIIDTPRTTSTSTFMSNMLYACSILYKTKLPMILVFNKADVTDPSFAKDWMTDFEAFQAALRNEEEGGSFGGQEGSTGPASGGSGYMSSLLNSMSLMLEEFYAHLDVVGVSAMTGQGVDEFFAAVEKKRQEFERDYKPELERRWEERKMEKEQKRQRDLDRLMEDMNVSGSKSANSKAKPKTRPGKPEPETVSDIEDEDEEEGDFGGDLGMVDPDEDEEGDGEEEDEETLQRRYHRELAGAQPYQQDHSFARYVQQAKH